MMTMKRYLLISLAAFLLLVSPAFAATNDIQDVDVEVNISQIVEWDFPGGDFIINITGFGDYNGGSFTWASNDITINTNSDWNITAVMTAWSKPGTLDVSDWVLKAGWDTFVKKTLTTSVQDLMNSDQPPTGDTDKLHLDLSGLSIDDGWGTATTTVTFTLVAR